MPSSEAAARGLAQLGRVVHERVTRRLVGDSNQPKPHHVIAGACGDADHLGRAEAEDREAREGERRGMQRFRHPRRLRAVRL